MAIKVIDKLPGIGTEDSYKEARDQVMEDVLQIIRENIPLCEITVDGYSSHYQRDAINHAIRRACSKYNRNDRPEEGMRVSTDCFELTGRKDSDGKRHWYIKFKKPEREEE